MSPGRSRVEAPWWTCTLARVGDVRVEGAAAQRIGERRTPVGRRLIDRRRLRVRHTPGDAFDTCGHLLAWNGPADEHDLPVHARDHPAAGRRLLDAQANNLSSLDHS